MGTSRKIEKVLIANRGEIAIRVARACADSGIASVAVYADPDRDAQHVKAADEAFALGGSSAAESYLVIEKLIDAAKKSGANAVHPGYGFLSENAEFAQAVIDAGLIWIGPPPQAIRDLGDKVSARHIASRAGAPQVQGTPDPVKDSKEVVAFAKKHGLPIAIKAAFGGGGRGLKVARNLEEIPELFDSAVREAVAAFGRGECFVERYLDNPRHVETQCLADAYGNVVVVSTRDCSLQRRHQKLVEEAPAPGISSELRNKIGNICAEACKKINYRGAGTFEFLFDDDQFYFIEMNTRIQLEHTITEEVINYDLIREQIKVAAGIPISGKNYEPQLHAIQCRINAEDPYNDFRPSPGTITNFHSPGGHGIRIDTHAYAGYKIPPNYDSMISKLIVVAQTRDEAILKMKRALDEYIIEGIKTTIPFHQKLMEDPKFNEGDFTTSFMDTFEY